MLTRSVLVGLLITQLHYPSCKEERSAMAERLIVNSHIIKDSTQSIIEFTFDKPIYMDMDGKLIEHGTMPAKVRQAIINQVSLQHKMADSIKDIYFMESSDTLLLNKLYNMTVEDLDSAFYTGEIRLNEKSYLTIQEKKH